MWIWISFSVWYCMTLLYILDWWWSVVVSQEESGLWMNEPGVYKNVSCYFLSLRPKHLPQHHILKHPHPMCFPKYNRPSFTPTKTTIRIIFLYIFIFKSKWDFIKQGFPFAVNVSGKTGKSTHAVFCTCYVASAIIC